MDFPEELDGRFHDAVLVADRSRFRFYQAWTPDPCCFSKRRSVLVKVPDVPSDLDGGGTQTPFEVQAALHARLVHPNIARLYSASLKPYPYIAMEFVEGRTLEEAASELSHDECADLMVGLVSAVVYMHGKGVCHGDVCLENVIVPNRVPLAKFVDFGLSEDISPGRVSVADAYRKKTEDLFSLVESCAGLLDVSGVRVLSSFPEVIVPRVLDGQGILG